MLRDRADERQRRATKLDPHLRSDRCHAASFKNFVLEV
jgi:hypothetical protein